MTKSHLRLFSRLGATNFVSDFGVFLLLIHVLLQQERPSHRGAECSSTSILGPLFFTSSGLAAPWVNPPLHPSHQMYLVGREGSVRKAHLSSLPKATPKFRSLSPLLLGRGRSHLTPTELVACVAYSLAPAPPRLP